eukprot:scaffold676_cov316-Pavlova_lutheri.AAC.2
MSILPLGPRRHASPAHGGRRWKEQRRTGRKVHVSLDADEEPLPAPSPGDFDPVRNRALIGTNPKLDRRSLPVQTARWIETFVVVSSHASSDPSRSIPQRSRSGSAGGCVQRWLHDTPTRPPREDGTRRRTFERQGTSSRAEPGRGGCWKSVEAWHLALCAKGTVEGGGTTEKRARTWRNRGIDATDAGRVRQHGTQRECPGVSVGGPTLMVARFAFRTERNETKSTPEGRTAKPAHPLSRS